MNILSCVESSTAWELVLVSCDCKFPQTGWLKATEIYSLSSGDQKSESRYKDCTPCGGSRGESIP